MQQRNDDYRDFDTMYRLFIKENRSVKDVAEIFGVGADTIIGWKKRLNIKPKRTRDIVIELWKNGASIDDIAVTIGKTPHLVRHHLRQANCDFRKPSVISEDQILNGIRDGLSLYKIAQNLNVDSGYLCSVAKRYGIRSDYKQSVRKEIPQDLVDEYIAGASLGKLQDKYGFTKPVMIKRLLERGIKIRSISEQNKKVNDDDVLARYKSGMSINQISVDSGISPSSIRRSLSRSGISFSQSDNRFISELEDEAWLRTKYQTMSAPAIAKLLNCDNSVVYRALEKFGIARCLKKRASKYELLNDGKWLAEQYATKSMETISIEIGCGVCCVAHALSKHDIPIRDGAESYALAAKVAFERYGQQYRPDRFRSIKSQQRFNKSGEILLSSNLESQIAARLDSDSNVVSFSRGQSRGIPDYRNNMVWYTNDFDAIYANGEQRHIEVKPLSDVLKCHPSASASDFHQFANGYKLYRDKFWIYSKSSETLGSEVLANMTKDHLYFAQNYPDWFKSPEELAEFLYQHGWDDVVISNSDLQYRLHRFLNCSLIPLSGRTTDKISNRVTSAIMRMIYHFHGKQIFRSFYGKKLSPVGAFGNLDLLKRACIRLYRLDQESSYHKNVGLMQLLFEIGRLGAPTVSQFKPELAAVLIDAYRTVGTIVFDPCAGWGARALGAVKVGVQYLGIDINPLTVAANQAMLAFVNKPMVRVEHGNALDPWGIDKFDILLTSPPFDDTEYYFGTPEGYKAQTSRIVESIFAQSQCKLSDGGVVILNLPERMEQIALELSSKYRFALSKKLWLVTSNVVLSHKANNELLLVFSRSVS